MLTVKIEFTLLGADIVAAAQLAEKVRALVLADAGIDKLMIDGSTGDQVKVEVRSR